MRNVVFFSSILLLFFLIPGCSSEGGVPHAPIEREKFVRLYTDLLVAGELGELSPADSARPLATSPQADSIFARHGVTAEQVRETVRLYSTDVRVWKEFYDEVLQQLEKIQKEEGERRQS